MDNSLEWDSIWGEIEDHLPAGSICDVLRVGGEDEWEAVISVPLSSVDGATFFTGRGTIPAMAVNDAYVSWFYKERKFSPRSD